MAKERGVERHLEIEMPESELEHRAIGLVGPAKDPAFALDHHLRRLSVQRREE